MPSTKTTLTFLAAASLAAPLVLTTTAHAAPELAEVQMAQSDGIEGQYIVYLNQDAGSAKPAELDVVTTDAASAAQKAGGQVTEVFTNLGAYSAKLTPEAVNKVRAQKNVKLVVQDSMVSIPEVHTSTEEAGATAVGSWGLDRIDQADLPLDNSFRVPGNGSGVHTYIIDTGVDTSHSEFRGRLAAGYDAYDNDNDPNDCQGHGTHVAGTVAGATAGVAPGATVHGVRVLGCDGRGATSIIIRGMDWVARNAQKPAVANLSLGGPANRASDEGIQRLTRAGVTAVVAAGNETSNACGSSPAREPLAITVASSNRNDGLSWFSNFGSCVDIIAPGSDIRAARFRGGFTSLSGTSMASPHVAGVAALYLATQPQATPAQVDRALKAGAVRGKISKVRQSPNLLLNTTFLSGQPVKPTPTPTEEPVKPTPTPTEEPVKPTPTPTEEPVKPTPTPTEEPVKPTPNRYTNSERRYIPNYRGVATRVQSQQRSARQVTVGLDVTHTCANHLRVDLVTPLGRVNTLKRPSYAQGRHCYRWSGIRQGTYNVQTKTNGTWEMRVYDYFGGAAGQLNGWFLEFK